MNEDAIKDAYDLFVNTGYNKSYENFKTLIQSNPNARKDAYDLFVSTGYNKTQKDFDELMGIGAPAPVKKKEQVSPSQQKAQPTSSATGAMEPDGAPVPSAKKGPSLQEQLQSGINLAASAAVASSKPGFTPVPKEEADKALYGKAKVQTGTLRGVPGERSSTVKNLNDKYKDLGVQFKEAPSKIQKAVGLGDIVVTADDGSTHIVQSTGSDEKLREEEAKLQSFLMGKSAGVEKKPVTPMEFLMMSRDGISPQEEGKFKRVYSQELVDNSIKFANSELEKTKNGVDKIQSEMAKLQEEAMIGGATPEMESRFSELQKDLEGRIKYANSIASLTDEGVKKAAGENVRIMGEQGNLPSGMYNSLLKFAENSTIGALDILNQATTLAYTGLAELVSANLGVEVNAEDLGSYDAAREMYTKAVDDVMSSVEADVSEEYIQSLPPVLKALVGAAEFVPNMLIPSKNLRYGVLVAQGIGRRMSELNNDPMTKDMPQNEKFFMSAVPSMVESALENFGLSQWAGANKGLVSSITVDVLSKVVPQAGMRGVKRLINAEINNLVLKGATNVAGAMVSEFETGALQSISDTAFREAYEIAKGKDLFKQPGFNEDGFKEALLEDAKMEALGGMWMAGAANIAQQTSEYVTGKSNTNETFALMKQILASNTTESALTSTLKSQVLSGKTSIEKAQNTLYNFREAKAIVRDIPQDLSEDNQRKAFDLIAEKRKLTKQIEGKDPSLVDKQKTRITAIDQELKNISNAVQEQATSEVPVQPGSAVSGEVAQGEPQAEPEVVTEEGQAQKEVIPAGKRLFNEPNPETVEISKAYKEKNGIVEGEGVKIEAVDVDNASKIADAFEALEDSPNDPEVQDAYNAMADETAKQHQDIIDAGYEVEIWDGEGEPYANAQEMIDDVKNNKHMYIFSTEQGFGDEPITDEQRKQNKLLQDSGLKDKNGKPLLYNDLFRFVHDFFGHTERGNGFGPVGEENAWDVHARMYSPKARRAMTTETRGQNSWVNFGPQMRNEDGSLKKKGDPGYLSPKDRAFAPQKMALMPEEFSQIREVVSEFDQAVNNSAQSLKMVAPDLKVIVAENTEDAQLQIAEALSAVAPSQAADVAEGFTTETRGQTVFVNGKPFAIVLDKSQADSKTVGHEAWELMLNDAFGDDQAKFKEFRDEIDRQLRLNGYGEIADALTKFSNQRGYEDVKYSEYMAELGGMLVANGFKQGSLDAKQKSLLQKIGDVINKFAQLFTGKKQFLDEATPDDILGFMITISNKVAKGEDVSQFFRGETPGATMDGGVIAKSQIGPDSVDNQFDMSIQYDDSNMPDKLSMPDVETIEKVLGESGGAAVFINSDGTKVGITRDNKKLQGGWRYTYFKENIDDNIGFAATSETHVGTFHKLIQQIAKERDESNPSMKDKPIAVFVTVQNAESMLGEWYAGEFLMDGIDKAITEKKTTVAKARKLMDTAIVDAQKRYIDSERKLSESKGKTRTLQDIKSDSQYKQLEKLKSIIKEKGFDTHDGRIKAAKVLGSKDFSFKFRSSFLSELIPLKAATGKNQEIKKLLLDVGYGRKDFYKDTMDEVLYDALEKANFKESSIGGTTLGGFYADPYVTKEAFLKNKNKGIQHEMFNESFSSNGKTFRLDKARNVNKLFPSMGFPDAKGYSLYNEANNSSESKASGIVGKNKVTKWLLDNGYEKNVTNPFTAISGTMYTSTIDADYQKPKGEAKVTTRSQKSIEDVTRQYPNSELAKQEGNEIGLSEITVDGDVVYIQAIEYPNMATAKPVIAWNSKGDNIAFANFRQNKDGDWYSMQSETNKSLQRKGIMNAIYDLAEKSIGKIVQSKEQSVEAKSFWDKRKSKSKKSVPAVVDEVLTDDGKGNYVFVHYSDDRRDTIKPMSGSNKNFTSREEVAAISSVGGVAMYYTKQGQKEQGVGNVAHTVLVPKDKVYFYGTTERGKVINDPENFYPEARRRFQEYKNMNNPTRPTEYAFDANNAAAWIGKVASENGYDMLVTNWGAPMSYRAQTVKELTPEAEYTGFKQIPEPKYEVGDEVFLYGQYVTLTDVKPDVLTYQSESGSGKYPLTVMTRDKIIMVQKAKPTVTTKSQKIVVNTIPGYERMMGEVEGILDKTMNRTGSYNQATANAVGYIQKSAVYERADDSQREQIIRDFVKLRGEKFKVAPSVGKLLGQIKDTKKVTVNEKTALKDQIKLEAKAAKDAVAFVKQLRMQISTTLRGMAGRGVISAKQASTILARYDRMNILNPDMRDRFVDYMANVFQSAEYADKVKEATKLRKTIRKAAKNPDNQAESSKLAKTFAEIDPSRVENIDDYLNNAEQMLKAVSRKTGDVKMRSLVNMTDMVSYIDKEIQAQRAQIKNEILSKYQDLVDSGVLDSKMTINEIQKVVDAIEENEDESAAKAKEAKAAVKQMMGEVSPILLQIARTGEDPFTGDPIELTPDEKRDLVKLAKMDLDSLSLADALKAVEYANNFISNGIFSGIGAIVSINEGSLEPAKLNKEGVMSRRLRKYFSPKAGRAWAEQLGSLPMLNKLLFLSNEKAIKVAEASGVTGISVGKAKAIKIVEKAVKEYTDKFSSLKDFRTGENIIERGILAFVTRTVIGDKFQVQDEFNRRKSLIEETIQALTDPNNSTDADIKKGELIEKVYDKILKDAKNVNDVRAKVSEVNKKAVDWWVNEWSKHYDRMDEVSRSVYNTLLTRDANFTPDRFQSIDLTTASENDFDSSFFSGYENVSTDKSGSLKENKRIKNLPSDKNGNKTRIVNLDFDMNNANALTNALIDVETASSVLKAKGFATSKDFGKIFSSKDDAKLYKRRLISYVNNVKGKSYVDQNELTNMGKALNVIGSFGTAKALFSLSQPFKQSIPPLFNTLVQTGRNDIGTLFSGGNEFIDKTGYPIVNRGISSLAELQAVNKKIAEAEKNLLAKGIMGIAEYNNKMLEIWLQKPDVFTARSSWLSFYIDSLKKQGITTRGIDWKTHEMNKKAADYAQLMVDSQQNVSDSDMQGMLLTDKTPYAKAVRKALFTLMTFTLNQKTRIWSDMRTLSNKKLTSEADRKEALLSLGGAIVELVSFHSISLSVAYLVLQPLVDAMMEALGYEDEEEDKELEKKKLLMNKMASLTQSFLKDFILPPMPIVGSYASGKVNEIMDEYGISEKIAVEGFGIEDGESKFKMYDREDYSFIDALGPAGIAAEKGKELFDFSALASTGKFDVETRGGLITKQILEENEDLAKINASIMSAYYLGILPGELAYIARKLDKKIKKGAEVVEEEED